MLIPIYASAAWPVIELKSTKPRISSMKLFKSTINIPTLGLLSAIHLGKMEWDLGQNKCGHILKVNKMRIKILKV